MHGPPCIFWANLTAFSHKLALARLTLETVVTMDAGALAFSLTDCALGFADVLVLTAAG